MDYLKLLPFSIEDEDEEDDVFDEDGDRFVAPSRNARFRKFGKEGTKNA